MRAKKGKPLPLGISITGSSVNFSVAVPEGKQCELLLYKAGSAAPAEQFPMEESVGEVHFLAVEGLDPAEYEYNYRIDGEVVVDPYARGLAGREAWGTERDAQKHEVRGVLRCDGYDWEGDRPLMIPQNQILAYSLHVRGFTKHSSSGVERKGTFEGVIEKLPYLTDLGINQIHCMPVYEFEECGRRRNYWGYGPGWFFAAKSAYSACGDGGKSLKDMVKACHKAGIEVVLEMPFAQGTPGQMMEECLRYYLLEYHVDGFILNPFTAPMEGVCADPLLKKTKILVHDLGYQTVMRRFLKGDEGMVRDVMYWLRHKPEADRMFNAITEQSGFTLQDLVSYDGKHNEANGEDNQDGTDYNYSWNCGAEGPSRKKAVAELRKNQVRNAFFLLLTSQGTPCILAGDEFGNSQQGNNNVYCQDNPVGWVNWAGLKNHPELHAFVKALIALRKKHPVLWPEEEMTGMSYGNRGIPDVSYHGENAWKVPCEVSSRQLGVFYNGEDPGTGEEEHLFIAYNMHWLEHTFALPALPKGKKWYRVASTSEGILQEGIPAEDPRITEIEARTVAVFAGR